MTGSDAATEPGEAWLADTPLLRGHAGTQPDLLLRWNAVATAAAAVDVAVHLHGFSQQGAAMPLAEKAARSGLDLAGRRRPTVAILPRGNWVRHHQFDFPALLDGGLDRLVEYGLSRFVGRPPRRDRLIVTAHSGGVMPAVDALAGLAHEPDELHLYDGLYGHDPRSGDPRRGLATLDGWLERRLAAEPDRPGALRVVYIERQTGPLSRLLAERIAACLAALPPQLAAGLAPRYRVERSGVPHGYVAAICGPVLLADPAADIDWSRV